MTSQVMHELRRCTLVKNVCFQSMLLIYKSALLSGKIMEYEWLQFPLFLRLRWFFFFFLLSSQIIVLKNLNDLFTDRSWSKVICHSADDMFWLEWQHASGAPLYADKLPWFVITMAKSFLLYSTILLLFVGFTKSGIY